jgi:hypothetical protein
MTAEMSHVAQLAVFNIFQLMEELLQVVLMQEKAGTDDFFFFFTDEQLLGFPASQQKIIRSAKQNYRFLLRLSHSWQDFLNLNTSQNIKRFKFTRS